MDTTLLAYVASILGAAIVGGIKIGTKAILIKQGKQHAHEIALANRFQTVANSFEKYANIEREDRRAANDRVMKIHEATINVVGDFKTAVEGMKESLDRNTEVIKEKLDAK